MARSYQAFSLLVALAILAPVVSHAGLSDDFGQRMLWSTAEVVGIYALYPIAALIILWLWRRRRKKQLALGLLTAVLAVGVAFPFVHRLAYQADRDAVHAVHVVPDTLDLKGRTILVVDGGLGCHDLCDAILEFNGPSAVFAVSVDRDARAAFLRSGALPNGKTPSALEYDAGSGLTKRNWDRPFRPDEIDYVVLKDFHKDAEPALRSRIPEGVEPANVGINLLMAPIRDADAIDLPALEPDLLLYSYNGRTWSVPLNWRVRYWDPVPGYRFSDRLLGRLLCPGEQKRLHRACSDI